MLHLKAIEFEKLTKDFEREKENSQTDLLKNFEADVQKQKEYFEAEVSLLRSKNFDLEKENVDYKRKSETLYTSLTDAMTELTDYKKKLEELAHSAKIELFEKNKEMEARLEEKLSEVRREKEEVLASLKSEFLVAAKEIKDLKESNKKAMKEKDEQMESLKKTFETKIQNMEKESELLKLKLKDSRTDEEMKKKIEDIKEECRQASEAALAEQKSRYTVRLKEVAEAVKVQYKMKIEEHVSKWTSDFKSKDAKLADFRVKLETAEADNVKLKKESEILAEKYEIAKQKIAEFVERAELKENITNSEQAALSSKYEMAKKIIQQQQEKLKSRDTQVESLKLIIDQLRKEVAGTKTESQLIKTGPADGFKHPGHITSNTPGMFKARAKLEILNFSSKPNDFILSL